MTPTDRDVKVLSSATWQKMILRWTELEPTGEVRLIAAAMGEWIHERQNKALKNFDEPTYGGSLGRALESACMALGIDFSYLLGALKLSWDNKSEIPKHLKAQRAKAQAV